ncbi:MAG: DNA-processing protein DprA [Armatimonadetes bacterium]|nr:DNA-processing protein DprA [Armatimonadota bacterium]
MPPEERLAQIALGRVRGIGGAQLRKLIQEFGSAADALEAARHGLPLSERLAARSRLAAETVLELSEELAALRLQNITVIPWGELPPPLRAAPDAPALLYVRTRIPSAASTALPARDQRAVAIIGSRTAGARALTYAERLAEECVARGFVVVSGLAAGVDRAAHRGALRAGGRTLAVPGCGLRVLPAGAPPDLVTAIANRGALLSPFSPETPVSVGPPLARNRVVTGLSLLVLVVEATPRGGAWQAADHAFRQGRAVYAVDWKQELARTAGNRQLLDVGARTLCAEGPLPWKEMLDVADGVAARLAVPLPIPIASEDSGAQAPELMQGGVG